MHQLMFPDLPGLPQVPVLRAAAQQLWGNPSVQAIWLGGSFATGDADPYSDLDLRIAVTSSALETWREPNWHHVFGQKVVGHRLAPFEQALLHHLVLADGTIVDLFVQTTDRDNPEHAVHVIGCRNEAFAKRLVSFGHSSKPDHSATEPHDVRELLIQTWLGSHKHRKVLARGLPLIATAGIHTEHMALIRLTCMLHSGCEMTTRPTIHSLTPAIAKLPATVRSHLLGIIGMPLRNEREIIAAIDASQQELSALGLALAERMGLEYPQRLEQTVRRAWQQFTDERDPTG